MNSSNPKKWTIADVLTNFGKQQAEVQQEKMLKDQLQQALMQNQAQALGQFVPGMQQPIPTLQDESSLDQAYQQAKAGGIHLNPAKKGTFKAQATRMKMSVQEAAAHILSNKENYSPAMVKKANFARNFAKEEGGQMMRYTAGGDMMACQEGYYWDGQRCVEIPKEILDRNMQTYFTNPPSYGVADNSGNLLYEGNDLERAKGYYATGINYGLVPPEGTPSLSRPNTINTLIQNSEILRNINANKPKLSENNKKGVDALFKYDNGGRMIPIKPEPKPTHTPIDPTYLEKYPDFQSFIQNEPEVALRPRHKKTFLEKTEEKINEWLGNPDTDASDFASNVDNKRHAYAGYLTSKKLGPDVGNILGALHEYRVFQDDTRPWSTKAPEAAEDMFNNWIGSKLSLLPDSWAKGIINYASDNNLLPDGVNRPKGDAYVKKHGGEMIKRADGSYSQRGLWDNIRANRGSEKNPTREMIEQERILRKKAMGGTMGPGNCPEGQAWNDIYQTCVPVGQEIIDPATGQKYLKDWYSQRLNVINNPAFANAIPESEDHAKWLNKAIPLVNEQLNMGYPTTSYVESINGDPNAIGQYNYDKRNPSIEIKKSIIANPIEFGTTQVHEGSTYANEKAADKFLTPFHNVVIEENIKPWKAFLKDSGVDINDDKIVEELENDYSYSVDPQQDNIHSNVHATRYLFNLQPDEIITEDKINTMIEEGKQKGYLDRANPNFNDDFYRLYKLSKDNKSMANLFNLMAANNQGLFENDLQYAKHGGNIGKLRKFF